MSESAPESTQPLDVEALVAQYIKMRNGIKQFDEYVKKKRAPLATELERISALITDFLDSTKVESVRTEAGTCYTTTRYTASLADPDAFMKFVVHHGFFDLLDRKANVTAVQEFAKEHAELPPGVNLSAIRSVGVRSPTKKA